MNSATALDVKCDQSKIVEIFKAPCSNPFMISFIAFCILLPMFIEMELIENSIISFVIECALILINIFLLHNLL